MKIKIKNKKEPNSMPTEIPDHYFPHEKLAVYQLSLSFLAWLSPIMESSTHWGDIKDQLDRASSSIPLNIAEGNGKFSPKDRCRFFDIAHGSALECAAGLDTLIAKRKLTQLQTHPGKSMLQQIVRMLIGLIKANSTRPYTKKPTEDSPSSSSSSS